MTRDYSQFFSASPQTSPKRPQSPLTALGWQPFYAQQTDINELTHTPPVRVVEVHRNGLHVIGDGLDEVIPPNEDATVGDWLMV